MPASCIQGDFAAPEAYLQDSGALDDFLSTLGDRDIGSCGIDTEADSMHSYETKLCLIQLALPGRLAIIDPLSLSPEGVGRFVEFIDRCGTVWMHGADYDISLFNRSFNWVPKEIYDTQIAARLLGVGKFGLANLLEDEYGVKLSKQSQKADWSKRPLSEKMLEYAYNDVRYLIDLGNRYLERLSKRGRLPWFIESCRAARDSVLTRTEKSEDEVWRVSGWGRLSPRGLHFLKHVWKWRDEECRRLDRPAFKFLGNNEILAIAENLDAGRGLIAPGYLRPGPLRRLEEAVEASRDVDPRNYPVKHKRGEQPRLDIDENRFETIRKFRDSKATELGIEPTVLATRFAMERLAAKNLPDREKDACLLDWQRDLMNPIL